MQLRENISLKDYNTFGINVYTKYFCEFFSADSLLEILEEKKSIEKMILGGGK